MRVDEVQRIVEKATDRGEVWLFVYGTLRPGMGNYENMRWSPSEIHEDVTLQGFRMYNLYNNPVPCYPVVFRGSPDERITGTLLRVDAEDAGFWRAMRMEVGAGYEPQLEEVSVPGYLGNAIIFIHTYPKDSRYHIKSGDWKQFCGEYDEPDDEEFEYDDDLEGF